MSVAERINICVSGANMNGLDDILAGFQREYDTGRIRLFHVATDPLTFELPTINKVLRFAREVVDQGTDAHIFMCTQKVCSQNRVVRAEVVLAQDDAILAD